MYPQVEVDLKKIERNTQTMVHDLGEMGISVMAVTKGFGAKREIVQAMLKGGAQFIADSRIQNLKKLKDIHAKKVLLRLPQKSEIDDVVLYADYSLNSEIETLRLLGASAIRRRKVHKVIVMVDLGDYREGIRYHKVPDFCREAVRVSGVEIAGFGVNLTCFGGVIPESDTLRRLVDITEAMKKEHSLNIEIVSGGSSSSVYLLYENDGFPEGINNLRLGEVILLGKETAFGRHLEGLHDDNFILKAQIIEVKEKPSVPHGRIGLDAFGHKPVYHDIGIIKRAIVAIGKQDVDPSAIYPLETDVEIIGASSDHMIMDVSKSVREYNVGDVLRFGLKYGGLLSLMTSMYVDKVYLEDGIPLKIDEMGVNLEVTV